MSRNEEKEGKGVRRKGSERVRVRERLIKRGGLSESTEMGIVLVARRKGERMFTATPAGGQSL